MHILLQGYNLNIYHKIYQLCIQECVLHALAVYATFSTVANALFKMIDRTVHSIHFNLSLRESDFQVDA